MCWKMSSHFSMYYLSDSSWQVLLNSHFMEGEQRYHKMLFGQKVGTGACSGPKAGVTGYP